MWIGGVYGKNNKLTNQEVQAMSVTLPKQKQQAATIAPDRATSAAQLAYIVSRFPKLTETFVLYEILEMERLGVPVEIYALLRERESIVQPEVMPLVKRARFSPLLSLAVLKANWHFIRRQPRTYLKVLLEVVGGTLGTIKFFGGAIVYFPKAVRFAYDMERQDIKHIHAQFANHPALVALIIHRLTGIPFSFTARGSDIHVDRTMLKAKLAAAEFMITVSASNKEVILRECGPEMSDKVHVIYGGIDTNLFKPRPRTLTDKSLRIVCVSRFEPVKGHAELVEACRLLQERGVDFECHLVGDGELRSAIETQITRAGLRGKVILHGSGTHKQVVEQLLNADVFVLATVVAASGKREGLPNVLKEAMACGLPVVASNISGIPELVEHEKSGFLVAPKDSDALATALQRLKADPELRLRMGQAGREKVVNDFDLHNSTLKRAKLFLNK